FRHGRAACDEVPCGCGDRSGLPRGTGEAREASGAMRTIRTLLLLGIAVCTSDTQAAGLQRHATELFDPARQRRIPVVVQPPQGNCPPRACPVAFLSPGYGLGPDDYRFLSDALGR